MPKGNNFDASCTIVIVNKNLNGKLTPETLLICTRNEDQGLNIKKALSNSFENIIRESSIKEEIPLAKFTDTFEVKK